MKKPTTDPALFTAREAARYLGVSKSYFEAEIRKLIPIVELKRPDSKVPMPRWTKSDLDAFIVSRRTERKTA